MTVIKSAKLMIQNTATGHSLISSENKLVVILTQTKLLLLLVDN
jgi:hypothetical protein